MERKSPRQAGRNPPTKISKTDARCIVVICLWSPRTDSIHDKRRIQTAESCSSGVMIVDDAVLNAQSVR
jgi:hypothetical protein